jgi:hypothetical protein
VVHPPTIRAPTIKAPVIVLGMTSSCYPSSVLILSSKSPVAE